MESEQLGGLNKVPAALTACPRSHLTALSLSIVVGSFPHAFIYERLIEGLLCATYKCVHEG